MTRAASRFSNDLRYRPSDHPNQTAFTPEYVLNAVRLSFGGGIELDPCTTPENPCRAERFYAPPQDGLSLPWDAESIYVNPPYGKAREPWVERCIDASKAGAKVALLIPAHPDTRIFQRAIASGPETCFLRGRLKFGVLRPNRRQVAASHPSALLIWNVDGAYTAGLGVTMVAA